MIILALLAVVGLSLSAFIVAWLMAKLVSVMSSEDDDSLDT